MEPNGTWDHPEDPSKEEVVFVLRVRANNRGWWGQVRRMDTGSIRNVAGMPDLFALLEQDWHLLVARDTPEGRE